MQTSPFRALGSYRVLPQIAGWKTLVVAFAARAPYAMIPLGVMTAVTASTGSVAQGGYATASVALSTAIAGPLIGKWADRRGQDVPLRVLTPLNALALLGMFFAVINGLEGVALYGVGVLVGVTSLPIGSFTRSRWISQTNVPHELGAALSYESMADEFVFVLGPALVGIAASAAFPSAPLFLAFALVATAGAAFALTAPRTHRDRSKAPAKGPGVAQVLWAVAPSIMTMTAIGIYFGATQAATTMRAELAGTPTVAGLVYATMGVGSAIMAIMTVAIPDSISLPMRLVVGGAGMAVMMAVAGAVPSLGLTAAALLLCGLFVGPSMVTAFTVTEKLAPKGGVAIAMTSMQSSVTIGVSLGSGVGGAIAQNAGDNPAYFATAAAASMVALVGLALNLRKRR
ncbi:MAG: MFS transporter [Actinomycetaceae bacterium]|nr:MFS transporter [Actinomycetaceae bacterium]